MSKYIAKPDTWFIEGTQCTLITDCRPQLNVGIFTGLRRSEGAPELHPVGEIYEDEESCNFDEFEIRIRGDEAEPVLREIAEDLASQSLLGSFIENLKDKDMSVFEWWETYLAWSEVSTKEDMERYYDTE